MPTLLSPTARRLDRLDEQAYRLRAAILEMMVTVSVLTPELRDSALKACVEAGLLTSSHHTFVSDFKYVIAQAAKAALLVLLCYKWWAQAAGTSG